MGCEFKASLNYTASLRSARVFEGDPESKEPKQGWGNGSLDKVLWCKHEDLSSAPARRLGVVGMICNPSIELAESGIDLLTLTGCPAYTTGEHQVQLETFP